MNYLNMPLAITDTENTGLDSQLHEIIEIGLIVVDQKTLKVLDKFEVKIKTNPYQDCGQKSPRGFEKTPTDLKI